MALLSVVALALVDLREHSRWQPERTADATGLGADYLRVLRAHTRRSLQNVRDVFYALAGLGGHLGRAGDGPPGWQSLWHGLNTPRLLVEVMHLAFLIPKE